jgi:hypothetical protein
MTGQNMLTPKASRLINRKTLTINTKALELWGRFPQKYSFCGTEFAAPAPETTPETENKSSRTGDG